VKEYMGRFYLVDPDGNAFIIKGVNYVRFNADLSITYETPYTRNILTRYGSRDEWAKETKKRLIEWGFNALGAWSDPDLGLPYMLNLHITPNYYKNKGGYLRRRVLTLARNPDVLWQPFQTFPDVFDPDFERIAEKVAKELVVPKDKYLIGYFTDNEVDFSIDTIFNEFMNMHGDEPGKRALIDYFSRFFLDISELNRKLGTSFRGFEDILDYTAREFSAIEIRAGPEGRKVIAMLKRGFAREAARKYAEICVKAIRSADPNHLILGGRFAGVNAKPVMGSFDIFDVISNNYYGEDPPIAYFEYIFKEAGRPIMLSEFSFRGEDTGHPNTRGAGIVVESQSYRALYIRSWLIPLLEKRFFVGYLWWEYMDEPFEGRRPDAEDSNYGLVNLYDEPYAEVIEAFKEVNSLFPIP
jgi:agarase